MRILVLIHNQAYTGPFVKVLEQCEGLRALGHEVDLLCTSRRARFIPSVKKQGGLRIIESPDLLWARLRQGIDPWNIFIRVVLIMRKRYDVVHAIDSRPVVIIPAMFLKLIKKTKMVLSWWDLFGQGATALERSGWLYDRTFGRVEEFFERAFRKYADHSTVISKYLNDALVDLGYPQEKISLLRLGCDTKRYLPLEKGKCREELQLKEHEIVLCFVGSIFREDKKLLVDSLRLLRSGNNRKVLTLLVGPHELDDNISKELDIVLTGRKSLSEVYKYLGASDLCVLPFRVSQANMARWPSKVGDYLNAGRPVVATKVGDLEELFVDHRLGYLSDDDSPRSFCRTLSKAVEDSENWSEIGRNCRRFAVEYLDTQKLTLELQGIYQKVLAE